MSPGSTDKEGYLYHEPAFPVDGKKVHRSDNRRRLQVLLQQQSWWNKRVLDLGCNVGFFSNRLALYGARVTGVDTDEEALAFATQQAEDNGLEGVVFMEPGQEHLKDKDVVLALSVLPWIHATKDNPWAYLDKLFKAPVAYVEIPYPPDGRANVPGVVDDKTAEMYLRCWYKNVTPVYYGEDRTDGILRRRTIWKCWNTVKDEQKILGSQCEVEIGEEWVIKRRRPGKQWDSEDEYAFLERMAVNKPKVSPVAIEVGENLLVEFRVHGWPLTECRLSYHEVKRQFDDIIAALERAHVSHNDVRPANLIQGVDGRIYLLDYGWATNLGELKPEGVNPVYGGKTDVESFKKILEHYPAWQKAVDIYP